MSISTTTTHSVSQRPSPNGSSRSRSTRWPRKYDLMGVGISATTYDEAVEAIFQAVGSREPAVVSLQAAHAVTTASGDPDLRAKVNTFEMIGPDGQPVRWALNLLHGLGLRDRLYGPELTLRLCRRAAQQRVPVYFFGSTPEVLSRLQANLTAMFPGLAVAGVESPPFRVLCEAERDAAVERINASGAGIVFIGLGAPKQDHFAHDHRDRIRAVQVCVGAAFDFHAGTLEMAPAWMQRRGLEWLYRLMKEPRRLWRRYLSTNSVFLLRLMLALAGRLARRRPRPSVDVSGQQEGSVP